MFIINQTMRRHNIHRGGHKARAGTRHRPYTHPRRASNPFGNGHRPGPGVRAPLVGALFGLASEFSLCFSISNISLICISSYF